MPVVLERIASGPPYWSNCYLVAAGEGAPAAVAIDPGGDPREPLAALARAGARLAAVLVTHCDIDHVAGVAGLAAATGAEVYAPRGEAELLRRGVSRGGMTFAAYAPEHELAGGDEVTLAGISFEVIDVPGHSAGHLAFGSHGSLFSGDLLFAGSVGRSDLPGGDEAALVASVGRLLERFGTEAVVYPGHGEPTTLGAELATNPFLAPLRAA